MAKEEKGSKKSKKDQTAALMLPTYTEKGTNLLRLNMNAFDPETKKIVLGFLREASDAYSSIARSHLKIGEVFYNARKVLENRGDRVFVAFLNEIPGMTTSTAYRYINAYEHAQSVFPPAVLSKILAANLPMLGGPDQLYGKYTNVVEKSGLGKELKKAIEDGKVTEEYAEEWIKKVQTKYSEQRNRGKVKVPDPTVLQQEAFSSVRRRYMRLPKNKKTVAWFSTLFAYILSASGFASPVTVDPRTPPKDWPGQEQKEEASAKDEAKNGKKEPDKEEDND